jgi:hypothetical protein
MSFKLGSEMNELMKEGRDGWMDELMKEGRNEGTDG